MKIKIFTSSDVSIIQSDFEKWMIENNQPEIISQNVNSSLMTANYEDGSFCNQFIYFTISVIYK